MDTSANRVAEHQRRALDFMLDTLGLRLASEDSRAPETQAVARAVAALEAENADTLRAEIGEHARRDPDRTGHDI